MRPSLRRVINATGVIIHTNLGRAPLAQRGGRARRRRWPRLHQPRVRPRRGARGRRDVHAERLLCRLTGAEAAVVVNNNAAATLLMLAALAAGREVIVSRGELVEIGGGFRVPDVMAQSGAVLREVGTTNRTRAADYAAAIGDRTAAILRVHPSNFSIEGFTERPVARRAGRARHVASSMPVVEDSAAAGSGERAARRRRSATSRSSRSSIAAGADVVCSAATSCSAGRRPASSPAASLADRRIRRHPLMRALRVDKLTYAALEATLQEYAAGRARRDDPGGADAGARRRGDPSPRAGAD